MDKIKKLYHQIQKETRHGKIRRALATTMAAVVVFTTTYSLILPAITVDYDTVAQMPGMDFVIDEGQYRQSDAAAGNGYSAHPENEDTSLDGIQINTIEDVPDYDAQEYLGAEDTWVTQENGAVEPLISAPAQSGASADSSDLPETPLYRDNEILEMQEPESEETAREASDVIDEKVDDTEAPAAEAAENRAEFPAAEATEISADSPSAEAADSNDEVPLVEVAENSAEEPAAEAAENSAEEPAAETAENRTEVPVVEETVSDAMEQTADGVKEEGNVAVEETQGGEKESATEEAPVTEKEEYAAEEVQIITEEKEPSAEEAFADTEQITVEEPQIAGEEAAAAEIQIVSEDDWFAADEAEPAIVTEEGLSGTDEMLEDSGSDAVVIVGEEKPAIENEPELVTVEEITPEPAGAADSEPEEEHVIQPEVYPEEEHVIRPEADSEEEHVIRPEVYPEEEHVIRPEVYPEEEHVIRPEADSEEESRADQEFVLVSESESTTESEFTSESQMEITVESESEVESVRIEKPEPETKTEPAEESETETDPAKEPGMETETDPAEEFKTEMETESAEAFKMETETEPAEEPGMETETEPAEESGMEAESVSEVEYETEYKLTEDAESDQEYKPTGDEEPDSEYVPVTEWETDVISSTEPETDSDSGTGTEPEPETESAFIPEWETDIAGGEEAETELEQETWPEPESETESAFIPEWETDIAGVTEPETDFEPETWPEPESETESAFIPEWETDIAGGAEPDSDFEPETWMEPETRTELETDSITEFGQIPEFETEMESEPESEYVMEEKSVLRPEWEYDIIPNANLQPDVEPETETESETVPEFGNERDYAMEEEPETGLEPGSDFEAESESESELESELLKELFSDDVLPAEADPGVAGSVTVEVPGADFVLHITYDETAGIPADADFRAKLVDSEEYSGKALEIVNNKIEDAKADQLNLVGLFDLTIYQGENVIKPQAPISIQVEFLNGLEEKESIYVVHFPGTGEQPKPEKEQDSQKESGQEEVLQIGADSDADVQGEAGQEPAVEKRSVLKVMKSAKRASVLASDETDDEPKTLGALAQETLVIDAAVDEAEGVDRGNVPELLKTSKKDNTAFFEASGLSYFALVSYTVDFHWEVNGKMYEFSIPGGGFVSFYNLVEVLGIAGKNSEESADKQNSEAQELFTDEKQQDVIQDEGTEKKEDSEEAAEILGLADIEVSENTRKFVDEVESIVFSDSSLLSVSKVTENTTVGAIKDNLDLMCVNSAELTDEDIARINATEVEGGDWALISLKAFDSEESLTVTMKNGEAFIIKVTDAQENPYGLGGQTFVIVNNNYALGNSYNNGTLNGVNINGTSSASDSIKWSFEYTGTGKEFLIHDQTGKYLVINEGYLYLTEDRNTALEHPVVVTYNNDKDKYSFKAKDNNQGIQRYNNNVFGKGSYQENNNTFWMELRNPAQIGKPGLISTADTRSDGIVINLFDYGPDSLDYEGNVRDNTTIEGINSDSILHFFSHGTVGTTYNSYSGTDNGYRAIQGIVQPELSSDGKGYPVITGYTESTGSLQYLFDPTTSVTGKTVYADVNHLFTKDEEGYYQYDSNMNYAYYDTSSNNANRDFAVYANSFNEEGTVQNEKVGFFPFNDYDSYYNCIHGKGSGFNGYSPHNGNHSNKQGHYNHHFGMTLTADFIMTQDGTYNGHDMKFSFSGDDDMWVFVDGVLVLDIGGIHNPVSGEIDFKTGAVTVSGALTETSLSGAMPGPTSIQEAFSRVTGKEWDSSPYSEHKLQVFYMERGGMYSNCKIGFNLPLFGAKGAVTIAKYNSDPVQPIEGVEFGVFTDPDCETDPIKRITSDNNGLVSIEDLVILNRNQKYYLKEIKEQGGFKKNPTIYTLEADAPDNNGIYHFKVKRPDGEEIETINTSPSYPVVYNEEIPPVQMSVKKKWAGGAPEGAYAKFQLFRYRSYDGYLAPTSCTLEVYRVNKDWGNPVKVGESNVFAGETQAVVAWTYDYYMGQMWKEGEYRLNDCTSQSCFASNTGADLGGPWKASVTLPSEGTVKVYIKDGNKDGTYSQYKVNVTDVTGIAPSSVLGEYVSVTNQPDPKYTNGPTLTLTSSAGWTGVFPEQVSGAINEYGIPETYSYYIKEIDHYPADYLVAYDSYVNGQFIGSPVSTTQTVTNYKNEVYVEKRWYGIDGNLMDPQPTTQVAATLSSVNGGHISDEPTKNIVAGTKGVWKVEDNAEKQYTAAENSVPQGFMVSYTFKDADETVERNTGGVYRGGTVYINNIQNAVPITVKKVKKGTSNPLAEAEFTLTRVDEENHIVKGEGEYCSGSRPVAETTGIVEFEYIKPGRYKLEETKIPDGYVKVEGPYYFNIADNGIITLDEGYSLIHTDDNSVTFVIENEPGVTLPNTGGPGTSLIHLFGLMLTAFGCCGLMMKRRRRKAA